MDDLIEWRNDTPPPEQIAELARQSHTLVDRVISSTVALHPPTANVAGERSALLDFARPGSWFGAPWDADGRMLTPEQTDYAIIYRLHELTHPSDAAELWSITGPPQSAATYQCQSGGIHHDPLVRLLAFRVYPLAGDLLPRASAAPHRRYSCVAWYARRRGSQAGSYDPTRPAQFLVNRPDVSPYRERRAQRRARWRALVELKLAYEAS